MSFDIPIVLVYSRIFLSLSFLSLPFVLSSLVILPSYLVVVIVCITVSFCIFHWADGLLKIVFLLSQGSESAYTLPFPNFTCEISLNLMLL